MSKNSTFWQQGKTDAASRMEKLDALCDISRTLSTGAGRQDVLCRVLYVLDKVFGLNHGTITLLAPDGKEVRVEAVHDLSKEKSRTITYRIGEGVTGQVMQTGKAAIVARVSREPLFLNRFERWNVTKQELSFICVPISIGDEVIGTISVDLPFRENKPLDEEVKILDIAANMIAGGMRVSREAAIARQKLTVENLRLRRELGDGFHPENIIGNSKAMSDVYCQIEQITQKDDVVLIRGETGTGKELVAHAIHYSSPRSEGPFIRVNCAALKDNLLEVELFGQEKGVYAGTNRSCKGRLDDANGGTLFLNEIGGLSLLAQAKLEKVLQHRQFERVDGSVVVTTNTRIIAASDRDLEKAVNDGCFQQNLYELINDEPIVLPPLRERKDDVLMLADHFVERYSRKTGKDVRRISTTTIDMLVAYHWPGNVRELENCIERAVRSSTDGIIHSHHLPPTLQTSDSSDTVLNGSFKNRVSSFERDLIVDALKRCNGNLTATARDLKATPRIIRHRVKELGIDYKRYTSKRG